MSEDQSKVSDNAADQTVTDSSQEQEFVKRKAYEEVTHDMHKYKQKSRDAQAKLNELQTQLKVIEEEKLKEKEEWQTLYERERQERERMAAETQRAQEQFMKSAKLAALKAELGGVKDAYLMHANIDAIEFTEDGSLSSESVLEVANQFRQEHSQLIPKVNSGEITSQAAPSEGASGSSNSIEKLSVQEKIAMLAEMKLNKQS